MATTGKSRLPDLLTRHESRLLGDWLAELKAAIRQDRIKEGELREQCTDLLRLMREAAQSGDLEHQQGTAWSNVRERLSEISRSRAVQGFNPSETAMFIFSFKSPLNSVLRSELSRDSEALVEEIWTANLMLDKLGLYTTEVAAKAREEVIQRQQEDMLELSTPVVKLWEGILALPMIGTLDSSRSQVVMEALLSKIVETGSQVAILDITGVPTVDTLTAQHLLKTVTAARLMGADCIISGIRPQIAQTIVHLGVDLNAVITKSSLADAFALALERSNLTVVPIERTR